MVAALREVAAGVTSTIAVVFIVVMVVLVTFVVIVIWLQLS